MLPMLEYTMLRLIALATACVTCLAAHGAELPGEEHDTPRSVILIIGDGFDDQHVTMGRNYLSGHDGELILDGMPVRSAVQVQTVGKSHPWQYVADSANTATSLATGVNTQMGRVGTGPDDEDLITLAERASAAGFKTGIVSSSSITDATPAAFMAHVSSRGCENPEIILGGEMYGNEFEGCPHDAKANGGPGSIAEQIVASTVDVALGGGLKHFQTPDPATGATVLDSVDAETLTVVTDREALMSADPSLRLLGLFAEGHLPVRLQGTDGRVAEEPDTSMLNKVDWRLGSVTQPEPMDCEPNPDYGDTPPLSLLTQAAIDHLSVNNERGLFLMVESASIDKQSHKRNPCGSIGEIAQLEETLAVALDYARSNPETLVIVTADHAQAAQIVPEPSLYADIPVPIYSPGYVARLNMPDGSLMTINYATSSFPSEEHTGANVPLFANSTANGRISAYMRQREVFDAMAHHLGLAP